MYMLDGKSKYHPQIFHQQSSSKSTNSNKSLGNFLESLSSFNQFSPNEESGLTIEEIEKRSPT